MTFLVPLIFPLRVEVARLDTAASAVDPGGSGLVGPGYDDEFREPTIIAPSSETSARGTVRRVESSITLNAQIEDESYDVLQMLQTGRSPRGLVRCVFHFQDLEAQGLLDDNRLPLLKINDRLAAIYKSDGTLIQTIPNPPGLYCTEAQPRAFGLGGERCLFLMTFEARELSVR